LRPGIQSYPCSCFATDPHDQTGRHEHPLRNHSSRPAEAYRRHIGWPHKICRLESSDTAELRRCIASSVGDTDPDVHDPDIAAGNATGRYVDPALRSVDAASRVAAVVAVAVDTAPDALAGTAVAAAVSIAPTAAIVADGTIADPDWTVDEPAAGFAALARQPPGSADAVQPSVADAAVERPGPAGLESAVFGFYQPVAVVEPAAAAALAAPGFAVFVVVVQLSVGSAAAELAEPAAVVAVCVPASVGALVQFSAHSLGRLSPGVTRHP